LGLIFWPQGDVSGQNGSVSQLGVVGVEGMGHRDPYSVRARASKAPGKGRIAGTGLWPPPSVPGDTLKMKAQGNQINHCPSQGPLQMKEGSLIITTWQKLVVKWDHPNRPTGCYPGFLAGWGVPSLVCPPVTPNPAECRSLNSVSYQHITNQSNAHVNRKTER
jgi:hypothetical protein